MERERERKEREKNMRQVKHKVIGCKQHTIIVRLQLFSNTLLYYAGAEVRISKQDRGNENIELQI